MLLFSAFVISAFDGFDVIVWEKLCQRHSVKLNEEKSKHKRRFSMSFSFLLISKTVRTNSIALSQKSADVKYPKSAGKVAKQK